MSQPDSGEVFAFPASYAQRRLWYLDQIESGTAVYNIPQAFRLKGALDVDVLKKALRTVVERHESLRTTFESEEGNPLQIVKETIDFDVELVDLSGDNDPVAVATARCEDLAKTGFSLEKGPLICASVFALGPGDHVLFLNVHHIICDGWSLALLFTELSKLYAAFAKGQASPLGEQEIQYADYAIWQQETFEEGDALESELGFWKDYLGGDLPQLALPFDRNRPNEPSLKGKLQRFNLTGEETDGLRALAKEEKASLFMTLMSAFAAFLSRISGETDVLIGSPIANRDREEIREAIGFYTNTVVFRSDLGGAPSFRAVLGKARDRVLGVLAHQEVPLELVIEAVNPDRTLGDNPVFQVMFAHQQAPESALSLPGITISAIDVHSGTSKFDLLLEMQELSEGMQCFFEYSTDLFDDSTAERLVTHFLVFLRELSADPDRPLAEVPLLTAEHRAELLESAATEADYPREALLHELVATQAAEHPDAVAIVVGDEKVSYRQLDERSNQVAHHLQDIGVGPDVMVGVCTERSVDMIVGLLGAMKSGAAYLPLDPSFPADRIAYMLEDSAAPILLTQKELVDDLAESAAKVVCLDDDETLATRPTDAPSTEGTGPESLAYMIYTSGSTGKPKGVQIPHRAVVNFLSSMAKTPGINRDDVLLAVTTLSFDISVLELMLPLTQGACVCIATHEQAVDGHDLLDLVHDAKATIMQATPATWRLMIEAGWDEPITHDGGGLTKVLCGGEAWPAGLARELIARADEVWNMYGPTETTIWSTCARITDPDHVPIGKPIANTQLFIVDKNLQLVPPGVAGELLIGGDGLARGYHDRPELTAERFVDSPFGSGKLYRTGDLVKRLPDGSVRYLNRLDNQVKVRGYRIELGEIESALEKHPDVKQPVVIVWDSGGGADKRLAAYIVYEEAKHLTPSELRKFLRDSLPDYMIPHLFVEMESLPLTANNKVNRRALPDPLEQGGGRGRAVSAPPQTELEKLIARVWREVLQFDGAISLHDDFFDLGGHSLLVTRVVAKLRQELGLDVSIRLAFATPTVRASAEAIESLVAGTRPSEQPLIKLDRDAMVREGGHIGPATFGQRRLWYLDQVEPDTALYNVPTAIRLTGELDVPALQSAWDDAVSRHEALRTEFRVADGQAYQAVLASANLPLELVRFPEEHSLDEKRQQATAMAHADAARALDLTAAPLGRARLYEVEPTEHVLVVVLHHIICDGWSLGILLDELSQFYASRTGRGTGPTAQPEIHLVDYAAWQEKAFGEDDAGELEFWRDYLAGELPQLTLPFDHQRPPEPSVEGWRVRFDLTNDASRLRRFAEDEHASTFMVLLSVFSAFLSRVSGDDEILVGSPIASRDHDSLQRAVGFFTNTVVYRVRSGEASTFRDLVRQVRDDARRVLAHQAVPLEQVIQTISPDRRSGENPVFQVMLSLQESPERTLALPGIDIMVEDVHSATSKFDLMLNVEELGSMMRCFFEYPTKLFDEATVETLVASFRELLRRVLDEPDRNLAEISLLTDEQRAEALSASEDTAADYPHEALLHELVAKQASEHPDAVAIVVGEEKVSYRQLDERSNQVAHHLQDIGVGPDVMVGVCTERGVDMIVGLLGAMKSGAAYLPLDPSFPADRIAYMLEDSKAPILLTHEELVDDLAESAAKVVCLDDDEGLAKRPTDAPSTEGTGPESLAYMIYTSGSTGKPKGVQIPHRAVVNFLSSMAETPGITRDDVLLAVTTLSFDISVLELMLPLTQGACVCVATHEQAVDGHDLLDLVREARATIMQATPATWRLMIEAGWDEPIAHDGGGLKKVLCGGEAWPAGLARELIARADEVWNMYGPTETTIWSTCARITDPDHVPIGKPIANTQLFIVDKNLQLVPPGVAGELLIGGDGLARGYHDRPELTAERFVDSPFGSGKLYRTGDLVKQLPDGSVRYLNRLDNQVKVRGYRIELGEIESALEKHPDVKQPVVIVWDSGGGADKRLAAYIVYEEGKSLTPSELRKFLRDSLPDYMIPHLFVEMESLPLTANNKVNRRALPDPLKQGGGQGQEFAPPATEQEKLVAQVWKEVLHLDRDVSLYDNFFDLGGHSLLSAQVTFKLEKATGHRLSPRAMVFQNLTQLAAELPDAEGASGEGEAEESVKGSMPSKKADPTPPKPDVPSTEHKPKGVAGWLLDKVKKRVLG